MDSYFRDQTIFFGFAVLLAFLVLFALSFFAWWIRNREDGKSPYGTLPLRRGTDVPLITRLHVRKFLSSLETYDNQPIDLNKAAICRETGRIFPNVADLFGHVAVDWSFISKRYPGNYVSWGSLSMEKQEAIRIRHGSLKGFQTAFSSPDPSPSRIEAKYSYNMPGPLYVDLETEVLVGWQSVPDTDLEVLIVQHPIVQHHKEQ